MVYEFTRALSQRAGIGVIIGPHPDGLEIQQVRADGPADRADLLAGDIITHVNGRKLSTLDGMQAQVATMAGRAGRRVSLTILRGSEAFRASVRREIQTLNDFGRPTLTDGVAYIPLAIFDETAAAYVRGAYLDLAAQGEIRALILDLRDNTGGATSQATAIADLFLPAGTSLYRFAGPRFDRTPKARLDPMVPTSLPMAVLINGNSASASEAVASALADQGRAILIGSTSFGKGTQQRIVMLPNGGAVSLTNAFILRKNDRRITRLGLTPHICAADVSGADALLRRLKNGRQPAIQRQSLNTANIAKIDRLCARSDQRPEQDLDLAQAILTSPSAYAAAKRL